VLAAFATHIRVGADGGAPIRVGWTGGTRLIAGIHFSAGVCAGGAPRCYYAVSAFSIANHIDAAA
jgi:hypothetical protein